MNFFEHQDRAKAKTSRLVWLFVLTVLLLTGLIYLTVAFSLVLNAEMDDSVSMWNPEVLLWVIVGNTLVIGGGCLFKMLELGGRGDKVAQMLGGRLVHPETTDPAEQRLIHVIEEMAIASGVTMPEVYVLKDHSINAFAAGSKTSEAVIGVTTGCLNLLSRDELQAVMAHEFSHILNGDMRLNIRMIALLHGILSITIIGRILLELGWQERSYGDDDEKGGNIGLALLGLAFMAIGGLGLAMSQVIKAAVSRQREFLADASAVQFTRNPEGITGALKKIGGIPQGSRIKNAHAEEASHLFFGNGLQADSGFSLGNLSTHPPLVERIRRIDPQFDGAFPAIEYQPPEPEPGQNSSKAQSGAHFLQSSVMAGVAMGEARKNWNPQQALNGQSQVSRVQLNHASELLQAMDPALHQASHDPFGAQAMVFTLLLSQQDDACREQMSALEENGHAALVQEMGRLLPHIRAMDARTKLPLVDLAIPSLRQLSPAQFEAFSQTLQWLIESDQQIDLFEFALQKVVERHLRHHFVAQSRQAPSHHVILPLLPHAQVLISGFAHIGHDQAAATQLAFERGIAQLGELGKKLTLLPFDQCNLPQMNEAIEHLNLATPGLRQRIIFSLAHTVGADGSVTLKEAELLRAFADALDCPIPPHVDTPIETQPT